MRLIDGDALKDGLIDYQQKHTDSLGDDYWIVENVLLRIEEIPTIDAEPVRHGKWIKMSDADGIYYACSECGNELTRIESFDPQFDLFPRLKSIDKTNYCPNCGAKMER